MTQDDWSHFIQGLAGQLQEKDNNLRIKSQRFWAAICNKDLDFSHTKKLVDVILSIKIEEITSFIQAHLMATSIPDRVILMSTPTKNSVFIQQIQNDLVKEP